MSRVDASVWSDAGPIITVRGYAAHDGSPVVSLNLSVGSIAGLSPEESETLARLLVRAARDARRETRQWSLR